MTHQELGEAELADLAGVPVTFVRRAAELGIVRPSGGDGRYRESDLSRLRLALARDLAGLPLDGIGKAVGEGSVAFDFLEGAQYRFAGHTDQTYEVAGHHAGRAVRGRGVGRVEQRLAPGPPVEHRGILISWGTRWSRSPSRSGASG